MAMIKTLREERVEKHTKQQAMKWKNVASKNEKMEKE